MSPRSTFATRFPKGCVITIPGKGKNSSLAQLVESRTCGINHVGKLEVKIGNYSFLAQLVESRKYGINQVGKLEIEIGNYSSLAQLVRVP
jgi:hypothetical protein